MTTDVVEKFLDKLLAHGEMKSITHLSSPLGQLRFTGWKPAQGTDCVYAQWVLYPPKTASEEDKKYIRAACVPMGWVGECEGGQSFDITHKEGSIVLTVNSTPEELRHEAKRSLIALVEYIMEHPPTWLDLTGFDWRTKSA